jgi:hypothetical protein
MNATNINPTAPTEPAPGRQPGPQPGREAVDAHAIDLKLRRAELRRELQSLGEKGKSYGSELWADGQHLASASWDYAKAAATVARAQVGDYVQKTFGRKRPEATAS